MALLVFELVIFVLVHLVSSVQSDRTYVGCFYDATTLRDLNGMSFNSNSMTIDKCYNFCYRYGYSYMGLENGAECYCDNDYSLYGSGTGCSSTCNGNSSQTCGGFSFIDVYSISYDLPYLVGFDRMGCYADWIVGSYFSLLGDAISAANCVSACKLALNGATKYAGIKNGKDCYCAQAFPDVDPTLSTLCLQKCNFNQGQYCGGGNYFDVYIARETTILGYQGCYLDNNPLNPDLNGFSIATADMTISKCQVICSTLSFVYAGLKAGSTCNCGNSYGRYGQSGAVCSSFCSGNQLQVCGGPNSNLVVLASYNDSIILPFGTNKGDTLSIQSAVVSQLGFSFTFFFNTTSYIYLFPDGDLYLFPSNNFLVINQMWPFYVPAIDTSMIYYRKVTAQSELDQVSLQIKNWSSTFHGSYVASGALVATYVTSKYALDSSPGLNKFQLIFTTNGSFSFMIIRYVSIYNTDNLAAFGDAHRNPVYINPQINGSNCGVPGQYIFQMDYAARSKLFITLTISHPYYEPGSTIGFDFTFNYMGQTINSVKVDSLGVFYLCFPNGTLATDSLAGYQVKNGFNTYIASKSIVLPGNHDRLTTLLRNASLASTDFTVSSGHFITWAYHSDYGLNIFQVIFVTNSSTSFIIYSYGQLASGSFVSSGYRDSSGNFVELNVSAYGSNIGVPSIYAFRADKDKSMLLDIPDGLFDFSNLTAQQVNAILSSGIDGTNCLVNCSSNGGCYLSNGTLKCSCYKNFTGSSCSSNLDPCTSFPCLNDGTCLTYLASNISNSSYSYNCSCAGSYSGFNCELKEDLCSNVSCSGHGVCKDWGQTANCTCFSMYTGVNCEKETQEGKKVKAVVATASIVAIIIIVSFYTTFVLMDLSKLYQWYQHTFKPERFIKPRRRIVKPIYTP